MFQRNIYIAFQIQLLFILWHAHSIDGSKYTNELLGSTLTDCTYLCRLLQFTAAISKELICGVRCERDLTCMFFQHLSTDGSCVICTQKVLNHQHFTELDRASYVSENADNYVYKNLDRITDSGGSCVPDCSHLQMFSEINSGVHTLQLAAGESVQVYCDMQTDGGGWTVFQRRIDGSEDFYRTWSDYENGFGDLNTEFWLGNQYISAITSQRSYDLRIDLGDFNWAYRYAEYSNFNVNANDFYRATYASYYEDSNAENSFDVSGYKFSAHDQDNDDSAGENCASRYKGGWWYHSCHSSNLNGLYLSGSYSSENHAQGVVWYHWHGHEYALRFTEMKIRPTDYVPPFAFYTADSGAPVARDCADHHSRGETVSGLYSITTSGRDPNTFDVYCDMDTDGGGWIVFQKRFDGSEDFYKTWSEYQNGFGSLTGEFWLGLDKVSYVTEQGAYEVRFDMEDYDNDARFAVYDAFSINRDDYYRLDVGSYSGDAGDSILTRHIGQKFTTYDNDQDDNGNYNCAERYLGAWWYRACHHSNLNGDYGNNNFGDGLNWYSFRGHYYSLMRTEIKIRPAGYKSR